MNIKLKQYSSQGKDDNIKGGEDVKDKDKKFDEVVEEVEVAEEVTEDAKVDVSDGSDTNDEDNSNEDIFAKTFELSHDDIRCKLYKLLEAVEKEDDSGTTCKAYDDYFIYSFGIILYYKQGYVKLM